MTKYNKILFMNIKGVEKEEEFFKNNRKEGKTRQWIQTNKKNQ